MNIKELVRLLAADAEALGLEATTERQVRDWIEESLLLPSRRVRGHSGRRPVWEMPAENLERGRRILVFRSQGATRSSGLMIRLWLEGFECPLFMLREALSKEMDRLSNRLFPDGNPVWIDRGEPKDGPKQAAMRERQLGPLDPRLEAFRVSKNAYASLAIISCDPPRDLRGAKVIAEIAERFPMIANLLQPALDGAWAGLLAKPLDKQTRSANAELIFHTTDKALVEARWVYRFIKWLLGKPGLFRALLTAIERRDSTDGEAEAVAAAAHSLKALEWEVLVFVLVLRLEGTRSPLHR